jgi:hypothetical protein
MQSDAWQTSWLSPGWQCSVSAQKAARAHIDGPYMLCSMSGMNQIGLRRCCNADTAAASPRAHNNSAAPC